VTDLPKKAKHRAVIATGRVVHKILQVIASGKHVALTDDHHGADSGRLTRLNQGGGERAYMSSVIAFFSCGRFNSIVKTPPSRVVRISMECGTSIVLLVQVNETGRT
jgi:hypothetical protein